MVDLFPRSRTRVSATARAECRSRLFARRWVLGSFRRIGERFVRVFRIKFSYLLYKLPLHNWRIRMIRIRRRSLMQNSIGVRVSFRDCLMTSRDGDSTCAGRVCRSYTLRMDAMDLNREEYPERCSV